MKKHIKNNETDEMERLSILYKNYRYLLYKVSYEILKEQFLAEDAVHNAFLKVSFHMDKIDDLDSLKTMRFLVIITKNTAIDMWRKRKNWNAHEKAIDDINEDEKPITELESDVDNCVIEAFYKLPEKYSDDFLLKYSCGYDNKRISEILGITESTIRQRLRRGKMILKQELEEEKKDVKG